MTTSRCVSCCLAGGADVCPRCETTWRTFLSAAPPAPDLSASDLAIFVALAVLEVHNDGDKCRVLKPQHRDLAVQILSDALDTVGDAGLRSLLNAVRALARSGADADFLTIAEISRALYMGEVSPADATARITASIGEEGRAEE